MPFYDVAIDDGRVAGAGLQRDSVVCFQLGQAVTFLRLYDKADILQMLDPCAAAASAGVLVDLDRWQTQLISQRRRYEQQAQPGSNGDKFQ